MFCHGTQIMDNSRICHCLLFMSMVSKTSCSHFTCQGSYSGTHTLGLNFTIKSWAESLIWPHANIHTGPSNAVTLVWGSLRLAPMKSFWLQNGYDSEHIRVQCQITSQICEEIGMWDCASLLYPHYLVLYFFSCHFYVYLFKIYFTCNVFIISY